MCPFATASILGRGWVEGIAGLVAASLLVLRWAMLSDRAPSNGSRNSPLFDRLGIACVWFEPPAVSNEIGDEPGRTSDTPLRIPCADRHHSCGRAFSAAPPPPRHSLSNDRVWHFSTDLARPLRAAHSSALAADRVFGPGGFDSERLR